MAGEESGSDTEEKKHPKCIKNLRWYFMEYCNNSSIHGFKYLGERRSTVEKLFWLIVITTSLYYCIDTIVQTYHKWERAPVIVSFATSETSIWEIPFPAVTICPKTKASKSKFNFTQTALLKNNNTDMDDDALMKLSQQFEYMSLVCSSKLKLFTDEEASDTIDSNIVNFLMKVQPEFNETATNCTWGGKPYTHKIDEIFKPTITSEGVCYSFNMLDRDQIYTRYMAKDYYEELGISSQPKSEWSMEEGYDKNSDLSAFPFRTLVSGSNGGLDLTLLTMESDLDYVCGDALQGYDVILHHPAQFPNAKQSSFTVGLNQDVAALVKPNMMKTSRELKRHEPENRNCYFTKERHLRFFSVYNQQDCLLECLANYTYEHCGCVGFYMPRDKYTPICGYGMQYCVDIANTQFLESEVSFKLEHPEIKLRLNKSEESLTYDCNCLASCDSLVFDAEVSQSKWHWYKGKQAVGLQNQSIIYHLSRLRIYFKDMQFITSQRNELYGPIDFMANCGGLLGLFTGFSIISLVEFVYFVTLRFACNFRKHGRYQWAAAEELMKYD